MTTRPRPPFGGFLRSHAVRVLAVALVAASAPSASAQCRLSTEHGWWGAIDRGTALVSDVASDQTVEVRFYDKTSSGWELRATEPIGDLGVFFSPPVAIDGDRAIAGAPEASGQRGRAFVFDRVGDGWSATELVSATNDWGDFFGAIVDLSGDVAVVSASHWQMGGGDGLAGAHVFEFDGTSWIEVEQIDCFGNGLAVDGDTIAIADNHYWGGASRLRIYERVSGQWTWTAALPMPVRSVESYVGSSIALDGDTLAIGVAQPEVAGTQPFVYVFRRSSSGWGSQQQLLASDGDLDDRFGHSVALSGSTLLVGAPGPGGAGATSVYRFEDHGSGFVEVGRIDSGPSDRLFGEQVAFQREDAIVASYAPTGFDTYASFFRLGFADRRSFCPTTPNSTGSHGVLDVEGCDSLAGQRLTFVADLLPPRVLARVVFGTNETQVPYGDGTRCVGAPLYRLPAAATDASGHFVHDVDFGSGGAAHITAGRTWHFQLVHRDHVGTGSNLTNALSIGITP